MSIVYTDYTGFSFNGIRTSDLGIVRVSDGSRYNENLTANFQDKTAVIEGGDGTLYWNSFYNQRPFTLRCAFDEVTEVQLRRMRQVFSARAIGPLSFYETPYKEYIVKLSAPAQISYVPFGIESDNSTESQIIHNHELGDTSEVVARASSQQRVYKGELVVSMVAYYPFARSTHKFLEEFNNSNKNEWAESSGLLVDATHWLDGTALTDAYDQITSVAGQEFSYYIKVYNPGDLEADFYLYIPLGESGLSAGEVQLYQWPTYEYDSSSGLYITQIGLKAVEKQNSNDTHIRINTRAQLIEGGTYENNIFVSSGSLYNKFIQNGDFFKIPQTELNAHYGITLSSSYQNASIEYKYLYH